MRLAFGLFLTVFVCATTYAAACGLIHAAEQFRSYAAEKDAESNCIAEHIAAGIERKDIGVKNGKCYIETNAYYTRVR